jgi:hypothetical protein
MQEAVLLTVAASNFTAHDVTNIHGEASYTNIAPTSLAVHDKRLLPIVNTLLT